MKKLSSILLTFLILVNIASPICVFSASGTRADVSRSLALLCDLELAATDEDTSAEVTRAEFVGRVVRVLNYPVSYNFDVSPFEDVSLQNEYYYEICNSISMGLISPAQNFYPDRAISFNEAIKVAVAACGYTFLADVYGGYPSGYIAAANRVDLTDGVSEGKIDRGVMFDIFYNILNCKLPEQEYTSEGAVNTMNAQKTVIQTMWHLEKMSGTIDSAQFFGGDNGYGAGEGLFCIDGIKLRSGGFNTDKHYASYVDAYYDEGYRLKSLYAYENDNKSDTLEFHSYDDVSFNSGTYTYYGRNDKEEKAKISKTALIVYNGKKSSYDETRMMPAYGSVKLIKGGGLEYDTVIINSYVQYVAEEISYDDMIISDYYDSKKTANLKHAHYVTVADQNGTVAEFSDINQYNIVWVAESDDKTLADIIISRDKIVGEYTGSSDNSAIYIDGGMYYKDTGVQTDFMASFNYGDVIIAYFNANREVVYVEPSSDTTGVNIAYLIQTGVFGGGMSKCITAKMLLTDGSIQSFDFADKFTVNGKAYSGDVQTLYDTKLPKDADYPSSMPIGIVSYILNSSNKISKINYSDSLLGTVNGDYTNIYAKKTLDKTESDSKSWENYFQYRVSENSLYGKGIDRIFTTDKTVQFMVPVPKDTGVAEDTDYIVKPMSSYTGIAYLTKMRHTGYALTSEAYRSDYIVSAFELSAGANLGMVSSAALAYLVTKVSNVITADGDSAEKLEAVDYQNRPITLYSKEENYFANAGVEEGCIIKAEFNTKNIVSGINVLYKAGDTSFCNTTTMSASEYVPDDDGATLNVDAGMLTLSNSFLLLGNLWDKEDPIYSFLTMNHNPESFDGTQPVYTYHMPKHITQFVCYDTKTGNVSYIKPADVKCYGGINSGNHYAVLEMSYGMVDSIFLYE